VNILERLRRADEDVYFLWIGGPRAETAGEFERIEALASRLGVSDRLVFTELTKEPGKYFETIDVFALTSREDPFPLVCLEAASLGKPVICFAGAGGMPEFVGTDAGAVVPLGDVDEFAREIAQFKSDRGSRIEVGRRAKEKVENEFSMESSCLKLEKMILG
jgi:glycosyltransferase involved in cell wall biosynthesis